MKSLSQHITESFVNESSSYPQKLEILEPIYLHIKKKDYSDAGVWLTSKKSEIGDTIAKDSKKKGEKFTFNEYNHSTLESIYNYDKNNNHKMPLYIRPQNLEDLIRSGAIKETFEFSK